MVWLLETRWKEQHPFFLRRYSSLEEQVRLTFQPLKPSGNPDPIWEEWHCYLVPLVVGIRDYEMLLKDYFAQIYPTNDPIDNTPQTALDPCSPNWLGAEDWRKIIALIQNDFETLSRKRQRFYGAFLRWLEATLEHTNIIVVEGNQ